MKQYKIAAIPGDGIGPEVIGAGLEVLNALQARQGDFEISVDHYDWGADYYRRNGVMMPEDGLDQIR
ncbi:MAG: isocitrate/isopropylmalate family dehydrogenase, partial [Alphaproteobacteria bacterium]